MGKRISIYPEKCTGCRLCELKCSFEKTGIFSPIYSRIRLSSFGEEAFYIPVVCRQCEDPWCLKACPSDAIFRDPENKVIRIDTELCVGCRMCMDACPFGTITYYPPQEKAIKCDECDGHPQCVLICPSGALVYEEESVIPQWKRLKTARKLLAAAKEIEP